VASTGTAAFELGAGGKALQVKFPRTGDYKTYRTIEAGTLDLPAGKTSLSIKPAKEGWRPVNLRSVKLVPGK
jgi:hypothetical protein